MSSLVERLLDTVTVLATPLLAAIAKKGKPKRPAKRHTRKRASAAKRPARPTAGRKAARSSAAKKTLRSSAFKKAARLTKTAGGARARARERTGARERERTGARAGERTGARAGARAATGTAPAKAAAAATTPPRPPPPKPVPPTGRAILLSPENGKFAESLHPRFRWLSVGGATRYEVAWSGSAGFSDSHTIVSIATEAAVPDEEPLSVGVGYYWRVRGGNESGWGPWSPAFSFQVLEEPPAA